MHAFTYANLVCMPLPMAGIYAMNYNFMQLSLAVAFGKSFTSENNGCLSSQGLSVGGNPGVSGVD